MKIALNNSRFYIADEILDQNDLIIKLSLCKTAKLAIIA